MTRRLLKLSTMAEWGAMLEELAASRGSALLVVACALTKVGLETNRGRTGVLSLSMDSSLLLASQRS